MNIRLRTCFLIFLFLICCVHTGSCEYRVTFGKDVNLNADESGGDEVHPFWDVPLSIKVSYVLALIAGFFAAFKFFPPFAGRIKSVLENSKRKEIFDYISDNPGRSIEEISSEMNIKRNTLRYHIKRLKKSDYIVIENTDNSKRIFTNHKSFTGMERKIISISHNPMQLKMISLISNYPGIRNTDLKGELGISKSAVTWHISRLESAGLLSCRKSGKSRHYYIKSGLEKVIVENIPEEIRKDYGFSA